MFTDFLLAQGYVPKATDDYIVELKLTDDFLQNEFSKIYTYTAINKLSLPNAPYIPFAEGIEVAVTTRKEKFSIDNDTVKLYFEHPFGTTLEAFKTTNLSLVPNPEVGGELYIGIDNTVEDQNIQLLFQIEEGSENPDAIDSENLTQVVWSYHEIFLWKPLKPSYLLKDETDNFLKTGLVAFTVPKGIGNTSFAI